MSCEIRTRTVFFSPRTGRHYMTPIGAARAEASARLRRLFPPEKPEYDERGYPVNDGWHYTSEPRLVAVHRRLEARYLRQIRAEQKFMTRNGGGEK